MAWSTTDKSPFIALSNGNATAIHTAGDNYHGVRGETGHASGLYYFEAIVPSSGNEGAVGLGSTSASLSDPLGYASASSCGLYEDGNLWINFTNFGAAGGGSFLNARMGFLVNLSSRRLWVRSSTGWTHGGDPAATGAGIDISSIAGDLFPMFTGRFAGDSSTLYSTEGSTIFGVPPSAALWGSDVAAPPETPPAVHRPTRMVMWF